MNVKITDALFVITLSSLTCIAQGANPEGTAEPCSDDSNKCTQTVPSSPASAPNTIPAHKTSEKDNSKLHISSASFSGSYASPYYERRSEGYDWTLFTLTKIKKDVYSVSVRSRSDKKKPTCTYNGVATLENNNTLLAPLSDSKVSMTITLDKDMIDVWFKGKRFDDRFELMRYCSGGGSLAGQYYRIKEK